MADIAEPARAYDGIRRSNRMLPRLRDVAPGAWAALAECAVEPNGYYLPEWALAVDAGARNRSDLSVLCARTGSGRLIGLLPVIPAARALRLPLPLLVAAEAYGTLRVPLLDEGHATEAARSLVEMAARSGARAVLLRDVPLEGKAVGAFRQALEPLGLVPLTLDDYPRACLDATNDAGALLRDALGAKKLKELRRLRHRLDDVGKLAFTVATEPDDVAAATETFLALEASGWKGKRGTALAQHAGDAAFVRRATVALAGNGQCEIATLTAGTIPVASGIVLRHRERAFWFKLGFDERFSRFSPGVQLALELTQHFCADPTVSFVDSTAARDNPLIDPIWRERVTMGDLLIPVRSGDVWIPVIRAALALHQRADSTARHLLRRVRGLTTKRQ